METANAPNPGDYAAHLNRVQAHSEPRRLKEGYDAWFGRVLPPAPSVRILDFGCGRGDFLAYAHLLGYRAIEGMDVMPDFADAIRERTGAEMHVVTDSFEFLRGRRSAFDCIVAKDVLEHLPHEDIVPLVTLFRESLRPGGRLIVSVPHAASPTGLYTRYLDFTHTTCFTVPSLTFVFKAAGFDNPFSVSPRLGWSLRPGSLALRAARTLWFAVLRLIFFLELPGDPTLPPHFYNRLVMVGDSPGHE
jgi:SAM-dependent methyltransferase